MSSWFWHKNWVCQKWYQSHVNHRNASLDRRVVLEPCIRERNRSQPRQINVIVHMNPPQSRKEVQRLTGRIVALNRLMSKLEDRAYHFLQYSGALAVSSGAKTVGGFRRTERSHPKVAHARKSIAKSTTHLICLRHTHSSKRSPHARKGNMRREQKAITQK
jgi:hypothetical protein